jgi:hypothetical protein
MLKANTRIAILFIILFSSFVVAKSSEAATLYIDKDLVHGAARCDDNFTRAENMAAPWAKPWCSFAPLSKYPWEDCAKPGDTIIVANGTYSATSDIVATVRAQGTSDAWITIKSETQWGAKINGSDGADIAFMMTGAQYIRIEDFEISDMDHGLLSNNGWESLPNSGQYVPTHDIYWFRNNVHHLCRKQLQCTEYGIGYGCGGNGGGFETYNLTYDSNIFHTNGRLPTGTCNVGPCLNIDPVSHLGNCSGNSHIKCSGNSECSFNRDYNLDHHLYEDADNVLIVNNVFYNHTSGWAIQLQANKAGDDIKNAKIINNTFGPSNNPGRSGDIVLLFTVKDLLIENNIFSASKDYAISAYYDVSGPATVRNNLLQGTTKLVDIYPGHENRWIFENNPNCAGNICASTDPKLTNPALNDYRLLANSPAINAGSTIDAPFKDYAGATRIGLPDIGAYEYVSSGGDITAPVAPSGLSVN